MRRVGFHTFAHCLVATVLFAGLNSRATAQTVWTGLDFSFTKPNAADPSEPVNQDRITGNVWLTRDTLGGIFNYQSESSYNFGSPQGTLWATALNNPGKTIASTNWADLVFTDWVNAYGGTGNMQLPARLLANNAVVRLVEDDIYLDLKFTSWTQSAGGGGFTYLRSAPTVPEPGTATFLLAALLLWGPARSMRQRTR